MLYFAYADNMDIETMGMRGVQFEKVITGKVKNYRLVFHKPCEDGTGKADLQDDRGSTVEGVIWDVPDASLDNLDVHEKVDKGDYRRQPITVQTSRGELECVTYRATKYRTGLKPSRAYLDAVIRGAQTHDLSSEYLTFLRSFNSAK